MLCHEMLSTFPGRHWSLRCGWWLWQVCMPYGTTKSLRGTGGSCYSVTLRPSVETLNDWELCSDGREPLLGSTPMIMANMFSFTCGNRSCQRSTHAFEQPFLATILATIARQAAWCFCKCIAVSCSCDLQGGYCTGMMCLRFCQDLECAYIFVIKGGSTTKIYVITCYDIQFHSFGVQW